MQVVLFDLEQSVTVLRRYSRFDRKRVNDGILRSPLNIIWIKHANLRGARLIVGLHLVDRKTIGIRRRTRNGGGVRMLRAFEIVNAFSAACPSTIGMYCPRENGGQDADNSNCYQ